MCALCDGCGFETARARHRSTRRCWRRPWVLRPRTMQPAAPAGTAWGSVTALAQLMQIQGPDRAWHRSARRWAPRQTCSWEGCRRRLRFRRLPCPSQPRWRLRLSPHALLAHRGSASPRQLGSRGRGPTWARRRRARARDPRPLRLRRPWRPLGRHRRRKRRTRSANCGPCPAGAPSMGGPMPNRRLGPRPLPRLARNRESARMSRRRKKEQLESLEEQVAALSERLNALRAQVMVEACGTLTQQRAVAINQLYDSMKGGAPAAQLQAQLADFNRRYGPNSEVGARWAGERRVPSSCHRTPHPQPPLACHQIRFARARRIGRRSAHTTESAWRRSCFRPTRGYCCG